MNDSAQLLFGDTNVPQSYKFVKASKPSLVVGRFKAQITIYWTSVTLGAVVAMADEHYLFFTDPGGLGHHDMTND